MKSSVYSCIHTRGSGASGIRARGLSAYVVRAAGETETTQKDVQDWIKLVEGDPGF
jgi:hypothetical protein